MEEKPKKEVKKKEKPKFPEPYMLVSIFITRKDEIKGELEKMVKGWWTGNGWFGYRLKPTDKVLGWDYSREHYG